jgi:hypothetical protein
MKLPLKETLDIGFGGHKIDLVIEDVGPKGIPEFGDTWSADLDYPHIRMRIYYPITLLELIKEDHKIPSRISGHGAPDAPLHKGWGSTLNAEDPRKDTHKFAEWNYSVINIARSVERLKQLVIVNCGFIKNYLSDRANREAHRNKITAMVREGILPPDTEDGAKERFSLIELK